MCKSPVLNHYATAFPIAEMGQVYLLDEANCKKQKFNYLNVLIAVNHKLW